MGVVRIGLALGVLVVGGVVVAGCSREPAPEGTATVPWAPSTTVAPSTIALVVESTVPVTTVVVVPTLVESSDEAEIRRIVEGSFEVEFAANLAGKDGPVEANKYFTKSLNSFFESTSANRKAANERWSAGKLNLIKVLNIKASQEAATATACLKNDIQNLGHPRNFGPE
jgi:hypothetical protein